MLVLTMDSIDDILIQFRDIRSKLNTEQEKNKLDDHIMEYITKNSNNPAEQMRYIEIYTGTKTYKRYV